MQIKEIEKASTHEMKKFENYSADRRAAVSKLVLNFLLKYISQTNVRDPYILACSKLTTDDSANSQILV